MVTTAAVPLVERTHSRMSANLPGISESNYFAWRFPFLGCRWAFQPYTGLLRVFPFPSPLACRVPPMEARTTTAFLPEMFGHVAVSIRALREEGD